MDFQKALDRESAKLALGVRALALEIVERVFAADSKAQKVKPKRKPTPRDRKWPYKPKPQAFRKLGKVRLPRKLRKAATPELQEGDHRLSIDGAQIVVGDLWKRRDGDGPRHVMAIDGTHITVDSPKYKDGTRVRREEFVKRYKRVG